MQDEVQDGAALPVTISDPIRFRPLTRTPEQGEEDEQDPAMLIDAELIVVVSTTIPAPTPVPTQCQLEASLGRGLIAHVPVIV